MVKQKYFTFRSNMSAFRNNKLIFTPLGNLTRFCVAKKNRRRYVKCLSRSGCNIPLKINYIMRFAINKFIFVIYIFRNRRCSWSVFAVFRRFNTIKNVSRSTLKFSLSLKIYNYLLTTWQSWLIRCRDKQFISC